MSFEALDRRMRVFETAHDHAVLPGVNIVARIDGRSFSQLTRVEHALDAPYDLRLRDCMVASTRHAMTCGFSALYGYTQSDEINVLFRREDATFGRKLRKLLSVLAGEVSAHFSLAFGSHGAFDCRISQLPLDEQVVDYFRWRQEDALRNALNGHCYWLYRRQGLTDVEATRKLEGVSVPARNELLFANGINFNDVPLWERRGIGLVTTTVPHAGTDPRTGRAVTTPRREIVVREDLPMKDEYAAFIRTLLLEQ